MPSLRIMAFKVVRGTPRRVAAALIMPPVFRRTRMIYSRFISASVPPAVSIASARSSARGTRSVGPRDRMTDLSMRFSISRTFPGQGPTDQSSHCVRRNRFNLLAHFSGILPGKVFGEGRYVLGAVAGAILGSSFHHDASRFPKEGCWRSARTMRWDQFALPCCAKYPIRPPACDNSLSRR